MKRASGLWTSHPADWRDVGEVSTYSREAAAVDPRLLENHASEGWWSTLAQLGIVLFVTREYEHLVLALSSYKGRPKVTYFPMPHPSGMAVDRKARRLYVASTRNPNQIFSFKPLSSLLDRSDAKSPRDPGSPMMPVTTAHYPGSLYLHDLAMIGTKLHANATGQNAVVRFFEDNRFERCWWPKSMEGAFGRNEIQLNSIAAGKTLAGSFFSASSDRVGRRRPGDRNYPVDGRGVIFAGKTGEPVCTGLTRPHSARLDRKRRIWVANSGYGEVGFVEDGRLHVVRGLPGWTRGLCIMGDVVFVGTSRILQRYVQYAPGVDPASAICAIHAICRKTGRLLGSIEWPNGNQIFSIAWMDSKATSGFPFDSPLRGQERRRLLFYSYLNR